LFAGLSCGIRLAEPREEGGEVGCEEECLAAKFRRLEFAALDGGIERGAPDAEHFERLAYAVCGFHEPERARVACCGVEAAGDGGVALALSVVGADHG
jgi:hypothetical protein